ncbi:putative F-box/kelch-repeat protein At1g12870 isoform X2 [Camellia sinensis]|uniref:putative F-box/kelch-repeat protein At1g12870 isoform X2 n=1 Tax=Camellia sinensis TaxID=4442 RepID=UPI001035A196|nr:putative F-box/kelch-repeat protein At1g12870 isoform X2 [Camellia sinensis]
MAHNTITTPDSSSSYTEQRSAGNAIAENSDLITQILVRLPVKPLTQFKSVSKQWLSLISDSQFSLHHSRRNRKPISALFLLSLNKINPEFSFLPFADCSLGSPHFQFLAHPVSDMTILFCCCLCQDTCSHEAFSFTCIGGLELMSSSTILFLSCMNNFSFVLIVAKTFSCNEL